MRSKERTCVACGAKYEYCPNHASDAEKPTWLFAFHDIECKEVFNILTQYKSFGLPKEEAKKQLESVLTHTIKFNDGIEKDIKEVLETPSDVIEEKPKKKKRIVTEN